MNTTKLKTWYADPPSENQEDLHLQDWDDEEQERTPYYVFPKADIDALFELVDKECSQYSEEYSFLRLEDAINKLRGV